MEAVERLGPAGHGGGFGFYLETWEWFLSRRLTRSDLTVLEDYSRYCAENWLGKKKKRKLAGKPEIWTVKPSWG